MRLLTCAAFGFAMLCGAGVQAEGGAGTAGNAALWVALQCERDTDNDINRNACIAKRALKDSPQQRVAWAWTVLQGPDALGVSREEGLAQAVAAFKVAAKEGYPPAYQGLAIALSHHDPELSAKWRQVAATSGMAEEAQTYVKRLSPPAPVAATFHLIGCHPAAYQERKLVRRDDADVMLKNAATSGLDGLRKRQSAAAAELADRFRACNQFDSYYLRPLDAGQLKSARSGVTDMLARVQRDVAKFPELGLLAWPAYDTLKP